MPNPVRDRRILWNRQGINYLLLDRFTTPAAAPLTSPRNCEPGPGQLTIVDTQNKLSISSGRLQFGLRSPVIAGDPAAWGGALSRAGGRALLATYKLAATGSGPAFGWSSTQSGFLDKAGTLFNAGGFTFRDAGTQVILSMDTYVGGVDYSFAVILRAAKGAIHLVKGGSFTNWTVLYVTGLDATATLYPSANTHTANTSTWEMDDFRVVDLPAPFTTDAGVATSYSATTANGDTTTMTADGIAEHTITAQTGVTQELQVRRTDDNNCWIVRCDQGGSTVALIEKNAGVETSRGSAAQTWTNGTQYRIVAMCVGTKIVVVVGATQKVTYTIANGFNLTATGVKVSHAGAGLIAWPRTLNLPGF